MIRESDDFIVEYSEKVDYIDKLIEVLNNKSREILNFFGLKKLSSKKKIKIWNSREDYQKYLEKYVSKYYEWMCGDTHDGSINMLSIEECRKTDAHKDMTTEEFLNSIVHEYVHACQQEINPNATNVEWFWEALATNLGNPFNEVVDIKYDKKHLMYEWVSLPYNYDTAFTIGKYMLENFSHDKILEYVKFPNKLIKDTDMIIECTKKWFNENYLRDEDIDKIKAGQFVCYSINNKINLVK